MSDRVQALPQATTENRMPPADSKERAKQFVMDLQDEICQGLEEIDSKAKFKEDSWEREGGGGGRTRVIRDGSVFEQGGVNFSAVWGDTLPPSILAQRPEAAGHEYFATGTSMVLHPRNPYVPTVHLNYRYFEAGPIWWFGGGIDLTPYYPFTEDVIHFHKTIQQACDAHHPEYYNAFKRWCDEYFYLKHRQEARGVGGIFFDYQDYRGQLYCGQNPEGEAGQYGQQIGFVERGWEDLFAFAQSCGRSFLPAYLPIVERRNGMEYGDRERNFQLYRRGRYVEFNLVYDRGTIFGLQTNGRTESILMSLPPLTRWEYGYQPAPGTPEAELTEVFLKAQDWVNWQKPSETSQKKKSHDLRFKFHHELEQVYHRCFDELTQASLSDREMSNLAQNLLQSRQEAFKPLLSVEELEEYQKVYPNEAP